MASATSRLRLDADFFAIKEQLIIIRAESAILVERSLLRSILECITPNVIDLKKFLPQIDFSTCQKILDSHYSRLEPEHLSQKGEIYLSFPGCKPLPARLLPNIVSCYIQLSLIIEHGQVRSFMMEHLLLFCHIFCENVWQVWDI